MSVLVRLGGAWRTITGAQVFSGGSWRTLVAIQVYSGGAWRQVGNFSAPSGGGGGGGGTVSVSISPSPFSGTGSTTPSLTATPSGGLAPYTYAWTVVSSTAPMTVTHPSLATTTAYSTTTLNPGDSINATLRCTVTDSLGTVGQADVSGTLTG